MHEKIKHPVLLTVTVVLVATITIVFWYVRIERSSLAPEQEEIPTTAQTETQPPLNEVPPVNLLPATPAVLPEL